MKEITTLPYCPRANGQVEVYIKIVKEKIRALIFEQSGKFLLPQNWHLNIFHTAMQIVRCDPSCAHGYAPAEILLGRKLVYPLELKKGDVDITGTSLTVPLMNKLIQIRENQFGDATRKIKVHQKKYVKRYNKEKNVSWPAFYVGQSVKVENMRRRTKKGYKHEPQFLPLKGHYKIEKIIKKHRCCYFSNSISGKKLKKAYHFDNIRPICID